MYFERRLINHWKERKRQHGKLRTIGERQRYREEDEWDIHHIIPRREGGSDEPSNLMLLRPNCHRQLHHGRRDRAGLSAKDRLIKA
ncbi:MAG: HNH endonuclease [Candidatus Symbiodolus clandestinus]